MATLKIKDSNGNWQEVFALKGNTGPKGEDGKTPDITLEVTTLPAGSTATVTKSGTSESPIFRLGIPKGDKGDTPTGVVKSVNNESPDINGNVTVTSVQNATTADSCTGNSATATKATQDANGNVITTTYATVASVNSVSTTATNAQTAANSKVAMSGSRGSLSGYNTPASSSTAVTINASSNDDTIVTAAVAVTISDGSSGQTWTKTVALQNASATVTLGSYWQWVGGSAPTIKANSILVIKWCGTFGLANLIVGS